MVFQKIGVPVTTQEQIKELKALDNLLKKKEF